MNFVAALHSNLSRGGFSAVYSSAFHDDDDFFVALLDEYPPSVCNLLFVVMNSTLINLRVK